MISLSIDLFPSIVMGTLWAFSRNPWLSVLGYFLEFVNDLMISLFLFSLFSLYETPTMWMLDLLDWSSSFLIFSSYILFSIVLFYFLGDFLTIFKIFYQDSLKNIFAIMFLSSMSLFVLWMLHLYNILFLFVSLHA